MDTVQSFNLNRAGYDKKQQLKNDLNAENNQNASKWGNWGFSKMDC